MTVEELIKVLQQMPPTATVFYPGGEHRHDPREIQSSLISFRPASGMFLPAGVYLGKVD